METQKFYTIGEAAKMAGTTIETLRHYDRIGLLKPAKTEPGSHYRYYTDTELTYLEVIAFCRRNKMPLAEIKTILNADFPQVVSFLRAAEDKISLELDRLLRTKSQISSLRTSLQEYSVTEDPCVHTKFFEQRAILLAEQLHDATIENFRRLHQDARESLAPAARDAFAFDNSANILFAPSEGMQGTMFAVCTSYGSDPALRFLGAGEYLCCHCTEKSKGETIRRLWRTAREASQAKAQGVILSVQFLGLFHWWYEVQIPLF